MELSAAVQWLTRGRRRERMLLSLDQPMTSKQLSHLGDMPHDGCAFIMRDLEEHGLVNCLNNGAQRSRVYWLTALGRKCQRRLRRMSGFAPPYHEFPEVDWLLYGWVCFSHRAAIIKALNEPMQPIAIKKKAHARESELRMSANNVRDVIRLFQAKGIVEPVKARRRGHPRYRLTDTGKRLRQLLLKSEHPA